MTMKRERIRYTAEQKQTIVARMMPPQNEAVAEIHEETKITAATLYKCLKKSFRNKEIPQFLLIYNGRNSFFHYKSTDHQAQRDSFD